MKLPVALGTLAAVVLVQLVCVESKLMTKCYVIPPRDPLPGEPKRKAATPEMQSSNAESIVSDEAKANMGVEISPTPDPVVSVEAKADIGVELSPTSPPGPRYTSCTEIHSNMKTLLSGVVTIYPSQYPRGLTVYCTGAWMTIQRRLHGSVNFTRSWAEYRDGFGNLAGEFWLGNEVLRRLTSEGTWELQVLIKGDAPKRKFRVQMFKIAGDNYALRVNPLRLYANHFSSGKSLTDVSLGQPFSTYDRDNDADDNANCAAELMGGWWFKTCTGGVGDEDLVPTNLNGEYSYPVNYTGHDYRGIRWAGFPAYNAAIHYCHLQIRSPN